MSQVLHFDFIPQRADWISRLMSELGKVQNPTTQKVLSGWTSGLGEIAGAIATRHRIVDFAAGCVDDSIQALRDQLMSEWDMVETAIRGGLAFRLKDGLAYTLISNVDNFLFETKAAYELVASFTGTLLRELGSPKATSDRKKRYALLDQEIRIRGGDTAWVDSLKAGRDTFIHKTAAWPALEVFSLDPFRAELLLLKRNVVRLEDESTFVRFEKIRGIYRGFCRAFEPLEAWLSEEIATLNQ